MASIEECGYELNSAEAQRQAGIQVATMSAGFRLGGLVFRGVVDVDRLSHWREPGSILALESRLDDRQAEQFYQDAEGFPDKVIEAVSYATNVSEDRVRGASRGSAMERQVAMYIIRTRGGLSYPKIGEIFSRDHTTVISAIQKIDSLLELEKDVPGKAKSLIKKVESVMADYLKTADEALEDEPPRDSLAAIAITRDGLHSYPANKIKPFYLKALRIKDPDTLVLEHDKRIVTDELMQRYGELAILVLNDLNALKIP